MIPKCPDTQVWTSILRANHDVESVCCGIVDTEKHIMLIFNDWPTQNSSRGIDYLV